MIGKLSYSFLEQDNEILRTINSISFDATFIYYVEEDRALFRRYTDGNISEPRVIDDFTAYLYEMVHPDDYALLQKEINHAARHNEHVRFEIRFREIDGRRYHWHSVRMRLMTSNGKLIYVGSDNYVDSRKNKESQLTFKARQDTFTGLLNKVATVESIDTYIRQHPDTDFALILFDVDNFKHFNDSMGHLFGDEVIKEVATLLSRSFSHDSFVGRIGGDEFLVFVKDAYDMSSVITRVQDVRNAFGLITLGQKSDVHISCSIGISIYPDMGLDYDTLFKSADMAMYYVKSNGRDNYAIYTEEIYDESVTQNKENPIDNLGGLSITNFAFKLLNEADDVDSAINLLLYKLQKEYMIDAIFVYETDPTGLATECTYECISDGYISKLGDITEFSHKAKLQCIKDSENNGGFKIYSLRDPEAPLPINARRPGSPANTFMQCPINLFSKNHGIIDFVTRYGSTFWNEKKCNDLLSICNLIAVCLYYSRRTLKAEKLANHAVENDILTGLMKEDNFIDAATGIIGEKGNTSKLAIIYCDISNFKYINEVYGYAVGDSILKDVAHYLSNNVTNVLCTGRFYSDNILCIKEFTRDTEDEELVRQVNDTTDLLSRYLSNKYSINGLRVHTGIYIIPDNKADVVQSVSNANMARKIAKNSGTRGCVVFNAEMFEQKKREIRYIQELDDAIKSGEFSVYLQPKVLGKEEKLVGAEALVRWRKNDGTMRYPDQFIPIFERSGSIVKLDFFVYETVMKYMRSRLDAGKRIIPVSMNVSRMHAQTQDFVARFKALIDKYAIPTEYLELELTESIYLENFDAFNDIIDELRGMGIRISMDDFGSGYSSLNALNDLKIDLLKIDRIFMRDENLQDSDQTIIRFIVEMAEKLRVQVLCEGVETDSQRKFLIDVGCDLHQGYLYSKPVDMKAFDEYMDNEDMLFRKIV
ncbi:MAG: EAL domain-containing protein [Lachnospiraceae bacterium]|nr:EAL domain-containing protein [Lachnospiraceae bacterium]